MGPRAVAPGLLRCARNDVELMQQLLGIALAPLMFGLYQRRAFHLDRLCRSRHNAQSSEREDVSPCVILCGPHIRSATRNEVETISRADCTRRPPKWSSES